MYIPMISASTIRQYVPEININISDQLINSATIMVQDTLLKDTIGQYWFDKMYAAYTGGTMTTADLYVKNTWLDAIISYGVWKHLIITLSLQLNEAGLRIKVSDHSQAGETKDLAFMRTYIENFIDSKRQEMYRYLRDNNTQYPYYNGYKYGDNPRRNVFDFAIHRI